MCCESFGENKNKYSKLSRKRMRCICISKRSKKSMANILVFCFIIIFSSRFAHYATVLLVLTFFTAVAVYTFRCFSTSLTATGSLLSHSVYGQLGAARPMFTATFAFFFAFFATFATFAPALHDIWQYTRSILCLACSLTVVICRNVSSYCPFLIRFHMCFWGVFLLGRRTHYKYKYKSCFVLFRQLCYVLYELHTYLLN